MRDKRTVSTLSLCSRITSKVGKQTNPTVVQGRVFKEKIENTKQVKLNNTLLLLSVTCNKQQFVISILVALYKY